MATLHLYDPRPAPNSSILLNNFADGVLQSKANPLVPDYGTIRSLTCDQEVLNAAHD
jgi:hypothetical protein